MGPTGSSGGNMSPLSILGGTVINSNAGRYSLRSNDP